ncbi:GNAT family N-acetyltransferase [Candidatus Falkowbacteria bacterium]|jgi:GNAT superfamily N-acetyltransferase|nr:GNAT family N-acetyltransferase [Candidatus Falkowbacteria bacterium]MBT4433167.1 GNAT family N-acetyltransferase [Candidatus Falkowbacteria bacterium]
MQIRKIQKEDKKEVESLFAQLTEKQVDLDIDFLISSDNCHCLILEDNKKIIGTATLGVYVSPIKGETGVVEDVVVYENYRGQGLGRKIMQELIKVAKEKNIQQITLTSNPKRIPARKLYESLGFKLRDTGFFVINL